jgi:NADPH:quinone reductase-like Zn-dependent oxidoreductase
MKAAIYKEYGPPEVVKIMEVNKPIPKDNEILIRVYASTVNRTDCGFRSAEYFISRFFSGLLKPKNQILGCEFAGQVASIGKSVSSFVVGDKVFGFNSSKFGAHAEYMTVPEESAISTIPENLTYQEAAPICEGGHYALSNIRAAKVKSGQRVLVNGTTGAIGSAMVQLLKHFGVHVTAVCDTPNLALVKSFGADVLIDYTKEDFTKIEQTFDVLFDAVGKSSFGMSKTLLKKDGIYISTELGKNAENIFLAMITPILGGKKVLFPIPSIKKEDVIFLKTLVEKKEFKPVMDRQYPLDEILEAHKYVETGQKIGNVVINIV